MYRRLLLLLLATIGLAVLTACGSSDLGQLLTGTFAGVGTTATWTHPHPPCGEDTSHPETVTVMVTGGNSVTDSYEGTLPTG